jgi:hypothetical protein
MNGKILLLLYALLFILQFILLVLCVKEEKEGKWKPLFISEIFSIIISLYHCYFYDACIIGILNCILHYVFYYFVIALYSALLLVTVIWYKIIFNEEEF